MIQVSAVTDQSGMQEFGGNTGDFDDDEGGGLVSDLFLKKTGYGLFKILLNYTYFPDVQKAYMELH